MKKIKYFTLMLSVLFLVCCTTIKSEEENQNFYSDVSPLHLDFDSVAVKSSKSLSFNITNAGSEPIDISDSISLSGSDYFEISDQSDDDILPGQRVGIDVIFSPLSSGEFSSLASVRIGASYWTVSFSGSGDFDGGFDGGFDISKNTLDFGETAFGETSVKEIIITNNGEYSALTAEIKSNNSSFSIQPHSCFYLEKGAKCSLKVVFTPQFWGSVSGTMNIELKGNSKPVQLRGKGKGRM